MNLVYEDRISLKDIDMSLIDDFSYVFYYSKRLGFLGIKIRMFQMLKICLICFLIVLILIILCYIGKLQKSLEWHIVFEIFKYYEHSVAN
ncbi:hypothetical protein CSUB8523_0052 [Campylobacter subantarcticus LMG 24377]|uniref:Uncharacterized protein n=1 Tax=Campylobacter subantarcticus LMG 24374 TaxID=1388751 RepID=A0A0A8H7B0_9BACT|nr:hypothetical protein [Campylobacter subantarcticus]AJC89961.1 hypothetical protein CSUB8521_0059 [Campylobacter subantarcticus LMG 24374]AJC91628.1 hypothetical protein CSUB8523_0052 [Campylobacter subantarcticus LMG 24377]